jgi:molecular chaperone DnaK
MARALGIDLGTTNSVMAYIHKGEPKVLDNRDLKNLTPSVVGKGKKGELLVGRAAQARAIVSSEDTIYSVKRFIGRHFKDEFVQKAITKVSYRVDEAEDGDVQVWIGESAYSSEEISALVLRRLKEDAEAKVGDSFTRAVITTPAYFTERQVAATRQAGKLAGFRVLAIINEPTAAALAFGLNREDNDDSKTILVYDLGGGTFDISIMTMVGGSLAVVGTEGDNLLGGDDFDNLIMEHILSFVEREEGVNLRSDKRAVQAIRAKAEESKVILSYQESIEINIPALGKEAIDLEIELARFEFEGLIESYIDRTVELTQKAISDASMTPGDIDFILLVGGSTAIPMVERKLVEIFGKKKIRKDVNPMECVAIGASLQTALLTSIECPNCHADNSIHNDFCLQCQTSLEEEQLICCPTCFTFFSSNEKNCFKCGKSSSLKDASTTSANPPRASQSTVRNCSKCGKPFASGQTKCSICDREAFEGGLKCPKCGVINEPGAIYCQNCKKEMPISLPSDITPKNLGIELADGRMAVIITKGETYPTEKPYAREFYTADSGQRRLEIPVFEGSDPLAAKNELVGLVTMGLPPGLPKGTPVNISFSLDKDRTIKITVKLRKSTGEVKNATLHHGLIDPELRKKVMEERDRLARFVDKWSFELTEAEQKDFLVALDQLDMAINEDASHLHTSVEKLLQQIKYKRDLAENVRATDAFNSAVLHAGGKYMAEDLRDEFIQISDEFDQARARADWVCVEEVVRKADEKVQKLSGALMIVIYARTFAEQNKVSPALQHKIYEQLRKIDEGVDKGDKQGIDEGIETLDKLWPQISQELAQSNTYVPVIHGVND